MPTNTLVLLYLCAGAGFCLVIGSLILIAKGRILVDSQTKEVSEIELPLSIKLKTNAPVILVIFIGAALLGFPIWQVSRVVEKPPQGPRRIYLNGHVKSPEVVRIVAVADEKSDVIGDFGLQVPLTNAQYTVTYLAKDGIHRLDQEIVRLEGNETKGYYTLRGIEASLEANIEVPFSNLGISRTESPTVVDDYKTTVTSTPMPTPTPTPTPGGIQ